MNNLSLGKSKIGAGIVALVTTFMIIAMAGSAAADTAHDGSISIDKDVVSAANANSFTITVKDDDLNTDAGSKQNIVVPVTSATGEPSTSVTGETVAAGNTTTYTTAKPVSPDGGTDRNQIDPGDFTYTDGDSTEASGISSVARNSNGTVTLTLDAAENELTTPVDTIDYTAAQNVNLSETANDSGKFTGSITADTTQSWTDSQIDVAGSGEDITVSYRDVSQNATDSATVTAATGDATMVDQGTGAAYIDNTKQEMVQEVKLYDLNVGDANDLKVDSFSISNNGSLSASELSQIAIWVDDGNGTWDGTGTETQLASQSSPSSFPVVLGGDDDSAVLSITSGGSKTVFITATLSGSADTKTIKTSLDASDQSGLTTSTLDTNDTETAASATIADTIDLGFSSTSAVETETSPNEDGYLDKITLTMNEALTANYPTDSAFTVTDNNGTTLNVSDVEAGGKGASGSTTVVIKLSGDKGTTGPPTVQYTSGAATEIMDDTANADNSFTKKVTDSAGPVLMSGSYLDSNDDGTVDNVKLNFSENLATYSFASDDWSIDASGTISISSVDDKSSQSGNTLT